MESSWGATLESGRLVRRWLELSRCWAEVGLSQGQSSGAQRGRLGEEEGGQGLLLLRCGGIEDDARV